MPYDTGKLPLPNMIALKKLDLHRKQVRLAKKAKGATNSLSQTASHKSAAAVVVATPPSPTVASLHAYAPFCSGCGIKREDGHFCPDCGTSYTKRSRTS